ncbi:MAG: hypothetical protein PVG53_06510, partial [Holophagae bacterium]
SSHRRSGATADAQITQISPSHRRKHQGTKAPKRECELGHALSPVVAVDPDPDPVPDRVYDVCDDATNEMVR